MYDLNQRTVAALDRLAEVYETFEDTWDIVVMESAQGDMLFASEEDAVHKLEGARQHQDRTLQVLEECHKSTDGAFKEFSNCRALHEAAWFDVKEVGRRHSELKRKAEEAHTRTFLQRESIRRATSDHVKPEEVLIGILVKDIAGGHLHALTCGVPHQESIEEWQGLLQTRTFREAIPTVSTVKWFKLNDSGNIPRPRCQCELRKWILVRQVD